MAFLEIMRILVYGTFQKMVSILEILFAKQHAYLLRIWILLDFV